MYVMAYPFLVMAGSNQVGLMKHRAGFAQFNLNKTKPVFKERNKSIFGDVMGMPGSQQINLGRSID